MRHFLSSTWILPLVLLTGSSLLCGVTSCKTTAKNSTLRDNSRTATFSELVARLEREVTEFVDAPLGGAKVSNSSSPALSLGGGDAEVLTADEINALRQKTVDMNQALARALRQYEEHSEQKRKQSEAVSLTLIEVAENLKSSGEGATPADLEKLRAVLALLEAGPSSNNGINRDKVSFLSGEGNVKWLPNGFSADGLTRFEINQPYVGGTVEFDYELVSQDKGESQIYLRLVSAGASKNEAAAGIAYPRGDEKLTLQLCYSVFPTPSGGLDIKGTSWADMLLLPVGSLTGHIKIRHNGGNLECHFPKQKLSTESPSWTADSRIRVEAEGVKITNFKVTNAP